MKIQVRRIVGQGERIPFGFAVAYLDYASFTASAYPVGLHLIVKVARRLYFGLLRYKPTDWESREAQAHQAGYNQGYTAGRQQVLAELEAHLRRHDAH